MIHLLYKSVCSQYEINTTEGHANYINYIYPYHFGSHMLVVAESQVASRMLLIESFHCNIIETI